VSWPRGRSKLRGRPWWQTVSNLSGVSGAARGGAAKAPPDFQRREVANSSDQDAGHGFYHVVVAAGPVVNAVSSASTQNRFGVVSQSSARTCPVTFLVRQCACW
jgi:hypothetical protein